MTNSTSTYANFGAFVAGVLRSHKQNPDISPQTVIKTILKGADLTGLDLKD